MDINHRHPSPPAAFIVQNSPLSSITTLPTNINEIYLKCSLWITVINFTGSTESALAQLAFGRSDTSSILRYCFHEISRWYQESACKEIIPDASTIFDHRCIDAVARSNHPNIVQVQDRWADQWPVPKVYVQTELLYGDLNQFVEANRTRGAPINHTAIWSIMLDIVEALTYAHELGWSHRNLKPRNGMSPVSWWIILTSSIG